MREQGIEEQLVDEEELYGRYIAEDIVDPENGEIHAEAGEEITKDLLERLGDVGAKSLQTLAIDHINIGAYTRNTLAVARNEPRAAALIDIYTVMRPREPPTPHSATTRFHRPLLAPALSL